MFPPVSVNAPLQSIMPAPVFSRSSFTICGVTFAMAVSLNAFVMAGGCAGHPRVNTGRLSDADARDKRGHDELKLDTLVSFGRELLRLGDPALDAAGQPDFLADLVGILGRE